MQERKWGRVVTIGSVQQVKPHHQMLVYSASKSALVNMVRSLSIQLAPDGITVNNMAPGTIHTGRNEKVLQDDAYRQKVIDDIPVGFIGEPEDCSSIVLTLCSDSGRYITGEDIFVGGGKHI
jgi:NAD(P)-dependent dehydrogenase (short-subunit alcohol dehydrogenase family)